MSEANAAEAFLKLFTFTKKKELEKHCKTLVIHSKHFVNLILACESSGEPFIHRIFYQDIVPEHLDISEKEEKALADNGVGPLSPMAAKAVRKMFQMFEERRYVVSHIFYTPNLSEWHLFCFDQRDLEEHKPKKPNHWGPGPHVHFTNWLWPGLDVNSVWSSIVKNGRRPGSSVHIRFQEQKKAGR